ncbi:MAG: beta-galactosidase trimerization domain-containing protein [Planctomycetota bacterium]
MPKEWYERPMRIVALQCNYEGGRDGTLAVADTWAEMGFNVEQLLHPMADGYSALFDPARHGDLLDVYIARAREKGLRSILYMNCHILGPARNDRREEWAQRDADGGFPKMYDTYYACCINSPWREHFFEAIDSLISLDIDGIFLDGPSQVSGGCRCEHCRAKYHELFGGDLNADDPDRAAFWRASRDAFLRECRRRLKRTGQERIFYFNFGVRHSDKASVLDALEINDLVGTEGGFMFYRPPRDAGLWEPTLAAKLLEAVAPEKPRVIFVAGDQKPWSWVMHTPAETRLCLASSSANAANVWYGLHNATRMLDTPGGRAARRMIRFLADHQDIYDATESAARVAVMYSFDTWANYRTAVAESDLYDEAGQRPESAGDFGQAFDGLCGALARSSVPFDVVADLPHSLARLDRYDVVFLPTCACLSDEAADALRRFAGDGGTVAATFDSSLYDADGAARGDFGLADVLGVSTSGRVLDYQNFNYFSPAAEHELFAGAERPLYPAPEFVIDVTAAEPADVLAEFRGLMAGRYVDVEPPERPAIVLHRFGEGRGIHFAGTFAEMCRTYAPPELRRIVANVARLFAASPARLEGAVGNVELVARTQGDRLIVHLVNYAGLVPRPFEAVAPQRGARLVLPGRSDSSRVEALVAGRTCDWEERADGIVISLPDLREYEVIVVT